MNRQGAPKTALITGAATRLGRAMALYLADRGYDIAAHFNSSHDAALSLKDEVQNMGRNAALLRADILDDDQTEELLPKAAEALQAPVTVLINNASIFEYDNITTATRDSWDRHMGSNLRAPFVLTQAFARQVPDVGTQGNEPSASGLVVNMVDQRVRKLTPEFMTYSLAKAALWSFTQTAAQALAPRIRVNAIGPGPTMQGHRQTADHFARQRAATILERGANPDDITAALGYFLDAPAVTGQLLCVDGGQHLAWKTPDVLGRE